LAWSVKAVIALLGSVPVIDSPLLARITVPDVLVVAAPREGIALILAWRVDDVIALLGSVPAIASPLLARITVPCVLVVAAPREGIALILAWRVKGVIALLESVPVIDSPLLARITVPDVLVVAPVVTDVAVVLTVKPVLTSIQFVPSEITRDPAPALAFVAKKIFRALATAGGRAAIDKLGTLRLVFVRSSPAASRTSFTNLVRAASWVACKLAIPDPPTPASTGSPLSS
jgi:hypothetical protein